MGNTNRIITWKQIQTLKDNNDSSATPQQFKNILIEHLGKNERIQEEFRLLLAKGLPENIIDNIPSLITALGIELKPYEHYYYSCIITDNEVESLVISIYKLWFPEEENNSEMAVKAVCREIVYSIPYVFRKAGYQLNRSAEHSFVNEKVAGKLARAVHSRYRIMMSKANRDPGKRNIYEQIYIATPSKEYMESDFDNLPDDIRQSNIDNAYNIPAKLLSLGLEIRKSKGDEEIPLLFLSDTDIETMAVVEHQRWCWEKRMNGYVYNPVRDEKKKTHNCLIPYDQLSESEKEKDRVLVRMIPALLKDIGFEVVAIDPGIAAKLGYRSRSRSKIDEVKLYAERLNETLTRLSLENHLVLPDEIKGLLVKLTEGISEVASAFSNAISIQRTYLPSPIVFRESLPDSFLLFKPKDGVGGDFYFVAKKFDAVIWICADCTGHGISAGLLTAICYNFIDQAVNQQNITDPAAIISHVMPRVEHLMRLNDGELVNSNGMELAVCTLYPQSHILFYAGLNRPLYHFSSGILTEHEPIRFKDGFDSIASKLKTQVIQLNSDDTVYLTSDGFMDQLGGKKNELGERFKNKRFKEFLTNIQDQNMSQQRELLNQTIEQWKQEASQEQTDDILVIGVKI